MNTKINYFSILIFLFFTSAFGQGYWEEIDSPTEQNLNSLAFLDSLTGWVVGDSGTILHTTDGGKSWESQLDSTDHIMKDIFFLNDSTGWIGAWNTSVEPFGTIIYKTTNAGETWLPNNYRDENFFAKAIHFNDTLTGFIGGQPGGIKMTTDGGVNWFPAHIDSGFGAYFPINGFNFFNDDYGYTYGGQIDIAGVIWKTTNGGFNWYSQIVTAEPIFGMHFFDSTNILCIISDPDFVGAGRLITDDAFETWDFTYLGYFGATYDLSFRTDEEGWTTQPPEQRFIFTADSGETWDTVSAPSNSSIYNLVFTDSLTGYATGNNGVILKFKKTPVSVDDKNEIIPPVDFVLYQNYPNPFNPATKIKFAIPGSTDYQSVHATLKVYDVLGREIVTLFNEEKQPGVYEVTFDAGSLSSGIYFYKLTAGNNISTKKMLLIK